MPVEKTNLEEPVCSAKGAGPIVVEAVSVRADTIALERKQISSVSARRASSSRTLAALVTFSAANFSAAVECTDQLPRPLIQSISTNLHSASLTGKPESWWMVKQYLHRQQPPAVVLLGSSQMQCFYTSDAANSGHDVDELLDHDCKVLSEQLSPPNTSDSANASCFNASLAGSMISDRYLVDKALFTPEKRLIQSSLESRHETSLTILFRPSAQPNRSNFLRPASMLQRWKIALFPANTTNTAGILLASFPYATAPTTCSLDKSHCHGHSRHKRYHQLSQSK